MGNLLNLAVYNPAILNDEDFLAAFVARQDVLDKILRRLKQIGPGGLAEHRLIVGQRGMGKTSLLRRIAIAVEQDADLSAVLLPLTFREEQYNVHNLHLFWCNCLDALGDYLERHERLELMRELDADIIGIARTKPKGVDDQPAYERFMAWARRLEKRPLLLLDNMDFIFEALDTNQSWSLRRQLQEAGGVTVIGAAARFLEAADQPTAPFYEFFRVDLLNSLGHEEMLSCLRELAQRRGEAGQKVLQLIANDPARLHTLRDLSGGNPRTLVLLYLILETDADGDVMTDLERLLDQVSPLYKGRIEDLAPQARVVLDATALAWDPVTAAEIAAASGIPQSSVTAQLDRLLNLGLLEKCTLSRSKSAGYQLGERFFNIWYLMRHASRRVRGRLRWLVEFLRGFYAPHERYQLAKNLLRRNGSDAKAAGWYALALRETLDDGPLRHALGHHATRLLEDAANQTRTELAKIVDLSELHGPTHSMTELRERVLNCRRDWHGIDPVEFWDGLGGSLSLNLEEKQSIVENLPSLSESQLNEQLKIWRNEKARWVRGLRTEESVIDNVRRALREGILESMDNVEQGEAAAEYLHCPELLALVIGIALSKSKQSINVEYITKLLQGHMQPTLIWAGCWNGLGNLLQDHLGRYEEAEQAYRQAIALDAKFAYPWNGLGNLLKDQLNRYEDAEQAYRQAIALDAKLAHPWNNLGNLLQDQLNRYEDAEQAYRQAIALDAKLAYPWNNLGNLLQNYLDRYEEAEQAYRQAIALDAKNAYSWYALGNLLQDHMNRHAEAEQAYRQALSIEPDDFYATANLAYLLYPQANRVAEAESCYQQAISRLPTHGACLLRAFRELALDNFGAAIAALREALDTDHAELLTDYLDDLLRNLRLAAAKGYGDKLLAFLDDSGLTERYWPLRAAFDAYLHGEDRLRDVNPEVRGAAQRLYDWLAAVARPLC